MVVSRSPEANRLPCDVQRLDTSGGGPDKSTMKETANSRFKLKSILKSCGIRSESNLQTFSKGRADQWSEIDTSSRLANEAGTRAEGKSLKEIGQDGSRIETAKTTTTSSHDDEKFNQATKSALASRSAAAERRSAPNRLALAVSHSPSGAQTSGNQAPIEVDWADEAVGTRRGSRVRFSDTQSVHQLSPTQSERSSADGDKDKQEQEQELQHEDTDINKDQSLELGQIGDYNQLQEHLDMGQSSFRATL